MGAPLVISFFTLETPYEEEVEKLIDSCQRFNIEHHIEGVLSKGSWLRNVAMKPQFICDKLLEFKRPLFWVDADAIFQKKPTFELFHQYDVAVREMAAYANDRWLKLAAGSIFLNYNPQMCQFARDWAQASREKVKEDIVNLFYLDQTSLLETLENHSHLKIGKLPTSYCKIFDEEDSSDVVIEHYQASRRFIDLI